MATDIFNAGRSENRIKHEMWQAFEIKMIKRSDEFAAIDFDCYRLDASAPNGKRLVGIAEAKHRNYPSDSPIVFNGPQFGEGKYWALRERAERLGVPALLICEWSDGAISWADIRDVATTTKGVPFTRPNRRQIVRVGMSSDVERQVFIPFHFLHWLPTAPTVVPAQRTRTLASVA